MGKVIPVVNNRMGHSILDKNISIFNRPMPNVTKLTLFASSFYNPNKIDG